MLQNKNDFDTFSNCTLFAQFEKFERIYMNTLLFINLLITVCFSKYMASTYNTELRRRHKLYQFYAKHKSTRLAFYCHLSTLCLNFIAELSLFHLKQSYVDIELTFENEAP